MKGSWQPAHTLPEVLSTAGPAGLVPTWAVWLPGEWRRPRAGLGDEAVMLRMPVTETHALPGQAGGGAGPVPVVQLQGAQRRCDDSSHQVDTVTSTQAWGPALVIRNQGSHLDLPLSGIPLLAVPAFLPPPVPLKHPSDISLLGLTPLSHSPALSCGS